jgi:gas vesicle protein
MRTLVAFLLGLIIGGVTVLFLPDPRRDELNAEVRKQTDALQTQLHQFGDQLKTLSLPKPEKSSASPSATGTPSK